MADKCSISQVPEDLETVEEQEGLIEAFLLDGKGSGEPLCWDHVRAWQPGQGTLWVHLMSDHPAAQAWLKNESNVDRITCEALLADEARPRYFIHGNSLMIILRGVNLNDGADPEDMVSLRMLIDQNRIISLRDCKLMAMQDMCDSLAEGRGPKDSGEFLIQISARMIGRMGPVVDDVGDDVDILEEQIMEAPNYQIRSKLSLIRRRVVKLRRYLAPERDVLSRLQMERLPWMDDHFRQQLREVADHLMHYLEDLDEARDRAEVTQEELAGKMADQMNRQTYMLTIVATIFLPLTLFTGLLGINVGGIPGSADHRAFWIFCGFLGLVAVFEIWLLRRKKLV